MGNVRCGGVQHAQQDAKALDQCDLTTGGIDGLEVFSALIIFIAPETTVLYCMRW